MEEDVTQLEFDLKDLLYQSKRMAAAKGARATSKYAAQDVENIVEEGARSSVDSVTPAVTRGRTKRTNTSEQIGNSSKRTKL
jgi:hypothetical protein